MLVLGLGLASCSGGEGTLTGSLTDFYDVSFETVRARRYSSEIAIEFVRETGEVPVRVVLEYEGAVPGAGTYDLGSRGDVTGRSEDTDIPTFTGGTLNLTEFENREGGPVVGDFEANFKAGDDTASLAGSFEATLQIIETVGGFPVPALDVGLDAAAIDLGAPSSVDQ